MMEHAKFRFSRNNVPCRQVMRNTSHHLDRCEFPYVIVELTKNSNATLVLPTSEIPKFVVRIHCQG